MASKINTKYNIVIIIFFLTVFSLQAQNFRVFQYDSNYVGSLDWIMQPDTLQYFGSDSNGVVGTYDLLSGGASLPSGSNYNVLTHNGADWIANTSFYFNSSLPVIGIGQAASSSTSLFIKSTNRTGLSIESNTKSVPHLTINAAGVDVFEVDQHGFLTIDTLSGTGERPVYADADGKLVIGSTTPATILTVHKTADENVISTTVQDDNHLTLSMEASTTYQVTCYLSVYEADYTASNIKLNFSVPTGTTIFGFASDVTTDNKTNAFIATDYTSTQDYGASASVYNPHRHIVRINAIVTTSTTSGSILLRWAPTYTSISGTTVEKGSFLKLVKE